MPIGVIEIHKDPTTIPLGGLDSHVWFFASLASFYSINVSTIRFAGFCDGSYFIALRWLLRVEEWVKIQADEFTACGLRS